MAIGQYKKGWYTFLPQRGFETTIPVFHRS